MYFRIHRDYGVCVCMEIVIFLNIVFFFWKSTKSIIPMIPLKFGCSVYLLVWCVCVFACSGFFEPKNNGSCWSFFFSLKFTKDFFVPLFFLVFRCNASLCVVSSTSIRKHIVNSQSLNLAFLYKFKKKQEKFKVQLKSMMINFDDKDEYSNPSPFFFSLFRFSMDYFYFWFDRSICFQTLTHTHTTNISELEFHWYFFFKYQQTTEKKPNNNDGKKTSNILYHI